MKRLALLALLAAFAAPAAEVHSAKFGDIGLDDDVVTSVNLSGFIEAEEDPTVPGWAKASTKPSYTAAEVGAVPTTRKINGQALTSDITINASDVGAYPNASGELLSSQVSAIGPAAANYTDSAIANADTSYRRVVGITNLNQSVQYLTNAPNNILTIELPAGSAATKDWIVYAYFGIETPLLLPTAIWWMADEAYTNAIPPNTPTALYFSQVADGIFTLSRQELKSVEIVVP